MSDLDEIRTRLEACPIPKDATADWAGTNHYEIQTTKAEEVFWWLVYLEECTDSQTEDGKRLGAVLDYATHYRRDVGALLARIAELEAENRELRAINVEPGISLGQALEWKRERDDARATLKEYEGWSLHQFTALLEKHRELKENYKALDTRRANVAMALDRANLTLRRVISCTNGCPCCKEAAGVALE